MLSHCVYYYKISKVCVVVDQVSGHWKQTGFCGNEYKQLVEDSSHQTQEVEFFDYGIQVEVRYLKDPEFVYKGLTGGRIELDGNPSSQLLAGTILMITGGLMIVMSICKFFYKDGIFSKWLAKRKGRFELEEEVLEEYYPDLQKSADHVAVDENGQVIKKVVVKKSILTTDEIEQLKFEQKLEKKMMVELAQKNMLSPKD